MVHCTCCADPERMSDLIPAVPMLMSGDIPSEAEVKCIVTLGLNPDIVPAVQEIMCDVVPAESDVKCDVTPTVPGLMPKMKK